MRSFSRKLALLLTSLLFLPLAVSAQNTDTYYCDANVSGYQTTDQLQVIIDRALDSNNDNVKTICFAQGTNITFGTNQLVLKGSVELVGPEGTYVYFGNTNTEYKSLIKVDKGGVLSVRNLLLFTMKKSSSLIQVTEGAKLKEVTRTIFYLMGSFSTGIIAEQPDDSKYTTDIESINESYFYLYSGIYSQEAYEPRASAISLRNANVDEIRNVQYYSTQNFDKLINARSSVINSITDLNVIGNRAEVNLYKESTIFRIEDVTGNIYGKYGKFLFLKDTSKLGSLRNVNVTLRGDYTGLITVFDQARIDLVENLDIDAMKETTYGDALYLYGGGSVGTINNVTYKGTMRFAYIVKGGHIGQFGNFHLELDGSGDLIRFINEESSIDLLYNGVLLALHGATINGRDQVKKEVKVSHEL